MKEFIICHKRIRKNVSVSESYTVEDFMQQFAKDLGALKHKKHNKPNSPKKQKPAKVATELGEMKSVKPTQSATQRSVLLFRDVVSIAQDSFLSAQA